MLPQSLLANLALQANHPWLFAFQTDWTNWKGFVREPAGDLDQRNERDDNSLVGSTTHVDSVPLHWKDWHGFHFGAERNLTESSGFRCGHARNDPVPSATLAPLTAAIMSNQISTGLAYRHNRCWGSANTVEKDRVNEASVTP